MLLQLHLPSYYIFTAKLKDRCFHKGKFKLLNARNHAYTRERCKSGKFSDFTLKSWIWVENWEGWSWKRVSKKIESVLGIHMGCNILCHISKVLAGESFDIFCIEEELTAGDLLYFQYAPVVSVDVERSFSRYKNVLSDNRRSLTFDNLRQLVVVYCNNAE